MLALSSGIKSEGNIKKVLIALVVAPHETVYEKNKQEGLCIKNYIIRQKKYDGCYSFLFDYEHKLVTKITNLSSLVNRVR